MKKTLIISTLLLVLYSPTLAGEQRTFNPGLPYTPVPRNPDSKMHQPYFGYESDRRMQGDQRGWGNESGYKCSTKKSYSSGRGKGRR